MTLAFAFACALLLAACDGSEPRAVPEVAEADEAELLERLSAIGYVAGSEPPADRSGVTVHEPASAAPGFNLMTSGHAPTALLLDMQGEVVHSWRADFQQLFPDHPKAAEGPSPKRNFWRIARLLPDGELIGIWELYGLFKLDRHSNILWSRQIKAHHDLQITPDGSIHLLEAARRRLPEIPDRLAIDDFVVERDAHGKEIRRFAISEALRALDWADLRRAFWERNRTRGYGLTQRGRFDPFHTNALQVLSASDAAGLGAPFEAGDVLLSMAMLDTIAVIDPRTQEVRWWQQGPFGMQHQPRVAPDGGIVVFDNHHARQRSAVKVFDPHTHRVVWEFTGSDSEPLHSRRSGGAEFLANGNLLVVETDRGRALELTSEKQIVWEYRSPYRAGGDGDRVAGIYSMQRIEESEVSWLPR
jgi:hypothetical protein